MPEEASVPVKETPRAWLYQPFESGTRAGTAIAPVGAVASYWSPNEAVPTLPALSVHVPLTDALAESGLEYVFVAEQEPVPEVPSVPENETESAWLYQPFESAGRDGAAVLVGGVLSIFTVTVTLVVPSSFEAEQVTFVPVVSAVSFTPSQPIDVYGSVDWMLQFTVTSVVNQLFVPLVPKKVGVIEGGDAPAAAPEVSRSPARTRIRAAA